MENRMKLLARYWRRGWERLRHFWRYDWKVKLWALAFALSLWFFLWSAYR
ncbi:MAG: hypothetical protein ABDK94_03615 [Atribacterota bacterium]